MTVNFNINYYTVWGENLYICGSLPELGAWNGDNALLMTYRPSAEWIAKLEVPDNTPFEYCYLLKKDGVVLRKEWGGRRSVAPDSDILYLRDAWRDRPQQEFLFTLPFTGSFFVHKPVQNEKRYMQTVLLDVLCPYVEKEQELVLCGATALLGYWNTAAAQPLAYAGNSRWQAVIDASALYAPVEYKLAVRNSKSSEIVCWETGANRVLLPFHNGLGKKITRITEIIFQHPPVGWKAAGTAIPVFSLRSEKSFGTGEFSDLKKLIDWAERTGQKLIQVLPVNDTTVSHTWMDSYPYNAISIYALHPLYLGLSEFPLKNRRRMASYTRNAAKLNASDCLNYEAVMKLKRAYITELFAEIGAETLAAESFRNFFGQNKDWLFPYACFSYLRDKFGTAAYSEWNTFAVYDKHRMETLLKADDAARSSVEMSYFVQYLLHVQLSGVKKYAHNKGIVLKGDIPIGVSRNSVETWVEPHLFNLDSQTGAPPDDFSVTGQNWGFPTYNWDEMAKDGYQWWRKRFRKMADYFDAYRIDHILGFFRIWEIPLHSVQGLLGYFSPALPLTAGEIENAGFPFDEENMTTPYIHAGYLPELFGEYTQDVINTYLTPTANNLFALRDFCNTQVKIRDLFTGKTDDKSRVLREGLYALCNEVLFIRDKRDPHTFHPRIAARQSYSFKRLGETSAAAFNRMYEHFFYFRHNEFWKAQAMQKLPALIASTQMLVCGEDLGMIPQCVPEVMNELQILRLEIQRMPKTFGRLFEDLNALPYLSVCATSTHDMSTIRGWWKEEPANAQRYYNEVLRHEGKAPADCTPELCREIVSLHLQSAAILAILPLQDWLSVDGALRRNNPEDERINIPSVQRHYWKYRMHITLEELQERWQDTNTIRR
ncbi:MAG: 4-alpha-glucanotransferase [Prevotella sp.]|jgi:4-alpha-glucanotransferase|nr:4-alpha-glucanotransferase [Prevotella sp.]